MISVIIPCYNQGKYLSAALDSLIAQTFTDWEAIIVNDGSTDETDNVATIYSLRDKRIRYFSQNNGGASVARNRGVSEAQGELISFLDADDWYDPECLKCAISCFESNAGISMFYIRSNWWNGVKKNTSPQKFCEVINNVNYLNVLKYGLDNKVVIRHKRFDEVGGFDQQMKCGFEDWEFYIRYLYHTCNVITSSQPLYNYRMNTVEQNVSKKAEQNLLSVQKYIYQKHIDKYFEYLGSPQMQYQWNDRLLPRMVKNILTLKQQIFNFIWQ